MRMPREEFFDDQCPQLPGRPGDCDSLVCKVLLSSHLVPAFFDVVSLCIDWFKELCHGNSSSARFHIKEMVAIDDGFVISWDYHTGGITVHHSTGKKYKGRK